MRSRTSGSSSGGRWSSLRVDHDVGSGLEQPAEEVDVGPVPHVEHAVGPKGDDVVDVRVARTPIGPMPQSSPASCPSLASEYT